MTKSEQELKPSLSLFTQHHFPRRRSGWTVQRAARLPRVQRSYFSPIRFNGHQSPSAEHEPAERSAPCAGLRAARSLAGHRETDWAPLSKRRGELEQFS